jgi:hypothetical protein
MKWSWLNLKHYPGGRGGEIKDEKLDPNPSTSKNASLDPSCAVRMVQSCSRRIQTLFHRL